MTRKLCTAFMIMPSVYRIFLLLCCFTLLFSACQPARRSSTERPLTYTVTKPATPYLLTLMVDARGLNYSSAAALYESLKGQEYRRDRDGIFGHAWICLEGVKEGKPFVLEGGHSGETGEGQPKYWDGVINYLRWGYSHPNKKQKEHPRSEPNPIKYLWAVQKNGYFERGSGGHEPTHIAFIPLTEERFHEILRFITEGHYNFTDYSLTGNQCASFVVQVAALAGVSLRHQVRIPIEKKMHLGGQHVILWEDPCYSSMTISSPDQLINNPIFAEVIFSDY